MNIHFVGISGIGISALAGYYFEKGHKVTGSCLSLSETASKLKKRGVKIFLGHKAENLSLQTDMLVHTAAVKADNPELNEARKRGVKILSYAEALGALTRENYTIGISGTHGKSTTTAMISLIMLNLDPSIIIGTKLKELGGNNYRAGKSKYLIIEADEYNVSFLNYNPDIAVINNIEEDHLDCYKNIEDIIRTFKKYTKRIKKNGFLVLNKDDKNVLKLKSGVKTIEFSLEQKEAKELKKILKVPGQHNLYNALGALSVARIIGIEDKDSFKALASFRGSWRRFEEKECKDFILIDDYAHHPTAVRETLKAAREKYPDKNIWCIFQPHQRHRTHCLLKDFITVFSSLPVNKAVITDIYDVSGREDGKIKVSSEEIAKKAGILYLPREELKGYVEENVQKIDVLLVMGAGDIYEFGKSFPHKKLTKNKKGRK